MIVRPKPALRDVLFALRGSIAQRVAIKLGVITLFAVAVTMLSFRDPELFARFSAAPFTLIGLSLSIFMSFRNNACYDRWWEGRKQWGQLLVEVRSLIRETAPFADAPERGRMLRGLCGFAHALAAALRGQDEQAAAAPWVSPGLTFTGKPSIPDAILTEIGRELQQMAAGGAVDPWRYTTLEARFVGLTAIQAACERIKSTPLPFAYTLLLHRTAYLFCCLLPFGIANPLGWATPLITAIVSYTFFGLDALGDELEQPFGFDINDLPLDALVRTVERDIRSALGETDLPPPLAPVDYLLT